MEAECRALIESLDQLVTTYRQLLEVVRKEQEALIETDLDGLPALNFDKEKMVLKIRQLEKIWTQSAQDIGSQLQMEGEQPPSLKGLAQKIGGEFGEKFLHLHSVLSLLVRRISETNKKNRTLTQSALSHINGAMQAITETLKESPTYEKGGKVREETIGGSGRLFARQI